MAESTLETPRGAPYSTRTREKRGNHAQTAPGPAGATRHTRSAAPIGRRRDGAAYHAAMPDDVRSRLLEGTYACVVRQGIGGTSLEDAAREAGVSRATLYRYFPGGRDEL